MEYISNEFSQEDFVHIKDCHLLASISINQDIAEIIFFKNPTERLTSDIIIQL